MALVIHPARTPARTSAFRASGFRVSVFRRRTRSARVLVVSNMDRLEQIAARLPDTTRVDIEAWGGEPTFRVGGKNFIFAARDGSSISVKLSKDEAAAVVATDPGAVPTGYGLGRHGWVSVTLGSRPSRDTLA